ncbi:MAG: GIY-YIG nuclease family protein [Bacteroidales bacterium]|nr:GIY-YIG nuclease family protein [Bacteroidales bacterium]
MQQNETGQFCVYILYSEQYDKIFIGYSSSLQQRLLSHNMLSKKGWTIKFRPWELVHTEYFEIKMEAMQREKELKTYRGREYIRKTLIKNRE